MAAQTQKTVMRTWVLLGVAPVLSGCVALAYQDLMEATENAAAFLVNQGHEAVAQAHADCAEPPEDREACLAEWSETETYKGVCHDWQKIWDFDTDLEVFQLSHPRFIRAVRDGQQILDDGGLDRCRLGGPPAFTVVPYEELELFKDPELE